MPDPPANIGQPREHGAPKSTMGFRQARSATTEGVDQRDSQAEGMTTDALGGRSAYGGRWADLLDDSIRDVRAVLGGQSDVDDHPGRLSHRIELGVASARIPLGPA